LPCLAKPLSVEDEDSIAFAGKLPQGCGPLVVEVVLVEGDAGQQVVQSLLAGAGHDLGHGVAVLVVCSVQQTSQVAFQGLPPLGAAEVGVEGTQETRPAPAALLPEHEVSRFVVFIPHYTPVHAS